MNAFLDSILDSCAFRTMKSVIFVWLDTYPEDFQEHPDYTCLHTIEQFAQTYVPESDMAIRAKHKIEKFKKEATAVKGTLLLCNLYRTVSLRSNVCPKNIMGKYNLDYPMKTMHTIQSD